MQNKSNPAEKQEDGDSTLARRASYQGIALAVCGHSDIRIVPI
jgi:hypothetical protein